MNANPNADDLERLADYYGRLTGKAASALLTETEFDFVVGEDSDPHSRLVNGLTTLYRACWDLTDLFRTAQSSTERPRKLELVIIALLFEVRQGLDPWVAQRIRVFYETRSRDPAVVLRVGQEVRSIFEEHQPALKRIRDRVFHSTDWHLDEVIHRVATAMYDRTIPGRLHKAIVDYGIQTVEQLCTDGVGIPGIGCFGVICIEGRQNRNLTYDRFTHDYWPRSQ